MTACAPRIASPLRLAGSPGAALFAAAIGIALAMLAAPLAAKEFEAPSGDPGSRTTTLSKAPREAAGDLPVRVTVEPSRPGVPAKVMVHNPSDTPKQVTLKPVPPLRWHGAAGATAQTIEVAPRTTASPGWVASPIGGAYRLEYHEQRPAAASDATREATSRSTAVERDSGAQAPIAVLEAGAAAVAGHADAEPDAGEPPCAPPRGCQCDCAVKIEEPSEIYRHWDIDRFKDDRVKVQYQKSEWRAKASVFCTNGGKEQRPLSYKWSGPRGAVMKGQTSDVMTMFDVGPDVMDAVRERGSAHIEIGVAVSGKYTCPDRSASTFACRMSKLVRVSACLDPNMAEEAKRDCDVLKRDLSAATSRAKALVAEANAARVLTEHNLRVSYARLRAACSLLGSGESLSDTYTWARWAAGVAEIEAALAGKLLLHAGNALEEAIKAGVDGIKASKGASTFWQIIRWGQEQSKLEDRLNALRNAIIEAKIGACAALKGFGGHLEPMRKLQAELEDVIQDAGQYQGCVDCDLAPLIAQAKAALEALRAARAEYQRAYNDFKPWMDYCARKPGYTTATAHQICQDAPVLPVAP